MSVRNTEVIDAATVREGWAVLSIYHFEGWDPVDECVEDLRRKIATYQAFVLRSRFQQHFHDLPVRIELVCSDPPPDSVIEMADVHGVVLVTGDIETEPMDA